MKKRFAFIIIFFLFLFPLHVNSHTTIGKIEFYDDYSGFEENIGTKEESPLEEGQVNKEIPKKPTLGSFGDEIEIGLFVTGVFLSIIAIYYLNQIRRNSK